MSNAKEKAQLSRSEKTSRAHKLVEAMNKHLLESVAGGFLRRGFFTKTNDSREVTHKSLLDAKAQKRVFGMGFMRVGGGKSTSYRVISTIPKRDRHNITNKLKQRSLKRKHKSRRRKHKSHRLKHKSHRLKHKSHRLKHKSHRLKYKSRRRKH